MALPWIIGAAAVAVTAAVVKAVSDDDNKRDESEERREREREIERENERRREEARKRERQRQLKRDAELLFEQYKLPAKQAKTMAEYLIEPVIIFGMGNGENMRSSKARNYAMECWDKIYGNDQDKELLKLENYRKALVQVLERYGNN